MSESKKPEGSLADANGVYMDEDGDPTAEMETIKKSGDNEDSD
jgi:hypothetical protein